MRDDWTNASGIAARPPLKPCVFFGDIHGSIWEANNPGFTDVFEEFGEPTPRMHDVRNAPLFSSLTSATTSVWRPMSREEDTRDLWRSASSALGFNAMQWRTKNVNKRLEEVGSRLTDNRYLDYQ